MEDGTEPELVRLVNEASRNGTRDWVQLLPLLGILRA